MAAVKSIRPTTISGENIWLTQEIILDGATTISDYLPIGTVNEFRFAYAMRDAFRGNNGQSAIGNWGGTAGYKLTIQGTAANAQWKGTLNLPASAVVQYKYVKRNGSAVVWESNQTTTSGNRTSTSCATGTQARADGNFKF